MPPLLLFLFADRLPPLIGGMEMHARYFIEHFQDHPRWPLCGVVTRDEAGRDCLLQGERRAPGQRGREPGARQARAHLSIPVTHLTPSSPRASALSSAARSPTRP